MCNHSSVIFILSFFLSSLVSAQEGTKATPLPGMRGTPSNLPDISVIGDITGKVTSDKNDLNRNKILVREIELALQGYIYPEMRADVFLAMHRHGDHFEPEICEAYASFLKIVGGLSLKVGKMHVDFGKINKVHQHERPYVDQPLVLTNFFGNHGLVGEGVSLGYLLPLPFFAQIDASAWRVASEQHHEEGVEEPEEFGLADEVYTTRLWTSFSLGETSELEIGASGASGKGSHYLEHQDEARVFGLDLTYKLWPSAYKRLAFQNEVLHLIRRTPVGELKRWGFYNYLGFQFNKYWDAGLRYDWSENAFPEKGKTNSFSGIITSHLTETTKIRLQYGYNFELNSHEAFLQLVFGIGPHSHPLQ
ncbi:MAG: hypothetical protein AB1393_06340 [Candidatus Edwardsbacteria bacterium]